jgi:hypothetical protein
MDKRCSLLRKSVDYVCKNVIKCSPRHCLIKHLELFEKLYLYRGIDIETADSLSTFSAQQWSDYLRLWQKIHQYHCKLH